MLRPIKNEQQYDKSLERIYELMQKDIEPDTKESDELEVLSILIKEYENEVHPMLQPNPLEAIRFRMDQMNISETELSKILGARSRKSEILSGKRKLSLAMIRRLKEKLNIPAEVLIQAY
ncbi:MAG: transcriptional regulator [Flavobacterium sp.]|nr:transcriptional regulator [Flavobacterium sp.]